MNTKPSIWTKSFISIACTNFFLFLTFYALLTTLPIYVTDTLGCSESEAGLIVTVFLLAAILTRPFSGKLLEIGGKRKMLFISLVLFTLCSFIYIWTDSFLLLLTLRFIHGIWFAIATTATGAIAADIIPAERRGEGLGYFAMSMNLAVVAGPFLALTLLNWLSFPILFTILALIVIGSVVFASMVQPVQEQNKTSTRKLTLEDLFEKKSIPVALTGLFIAFSYSSIISFISIYAKSIGLIETASLFFAVFAVTMLLSRPFVGKLFDARGPNVVIYPSLFLYATGLYMLSMTDSSTMLLLSAGMIGLGYGSLVPSFQTLAIQQADTHRSGHATATFFTFFDTGIASGSFILGMVVTYVGYHPLYVAMSLFVIVIMYLYYRLVSTRIKNQKSQSHSS
ncbi:MFS transporter [Pontibacillus salicampi]|uniref:MFS transporter n=1 Tax=Pontibacillus salicampi TaxID=1449801 RepID=A0ABV6LPP4_9BACI